MRVYSFNWDLILIFENNLPGWDQPGKLMLNTWECHLQSTSTYWYQG